MKKILAFALMLTAAVVLAACDSRPVLRILNWGEYINDAVVDRFEEEFGYRVIVDVADSNEAFYSKIKSGTTAYDIVIPSDYMIEKMQEENMLIELDYSLLPNRDNVTYMSGVDQIFDSMTATTLTRTSESVDFTKYAVPYFWGTFGIIYNNRIAGLETALETHGWGAYFDPSKAPAGVRRGMYDVPQFAYAAAMLYLDQNVNAFSQSLLDQAEDAIDQANFVEWGDDSLKRNVEAGNLDMALVYTGDYLDRLYIQLDEGKTLSEVQAEFNIYVPEDTFVFADMMVIPNTSKNVDRAHEFINFMLDPENVALNAEVVGYAAALVEAYDLIMENLTSDDEWYKNWALANQTYYNKNAVLSVAPLTALNPSDIDKINTMIDNVRS
ncbi:extracellular solute-binding protein [Paracholeplasma manati]|uniref:extracellular solute-binding protein n=1 Tax=Paracholeplasma manati TaxID=591373 RepID=UPI00240880E9|nr:extracellular solute-binding protein [Paracholeplasma manati]MDG0889469.1 extracellular solute-binding protein [Paracholeplasma manati]